MKKFIFFLLLIATFSVSRSQQLPAIDVLASASKIAAKENKKVFVLFGASWCYWCHKMDSCMNDETLKPFFDKNYVITHLTIFESDNKKELENAGVRDLYKKYGGSENQGIPYWIILDTNGNLLADSKLKSGDNSGCPAKKEEVDHFLDVLKSTSSLTEAQLEVIGKKFRLNDR